MPPRPCVVRDMPQEQRDEIVRLYVDERMSAAAIGRKLYFSGTTIGRVLIAEGVQRRKPGEVVYPRKNNITQAGYDRTLELYQSGLGEREIAAIIGVSATAVRYRLRRAGYTPRSHGDAQRARWRHRLATHGARCLTDRQRKALALLDENPVTSVDLARALNLQRRPTGVTPTQVARQTLEQLERYGLARRRPVTPGGRIFEWHRTDLALRDVLEHELAPPPQRKTGDVWLPIGPLRDWLHKLIAFERTRAAAAGCEDLAEYGLGATARKLGLTERRMFSLLNEQQSVTLSLADELLTRAGDGTRLDDLWPPLGTDGELVEFPRRVYKTTDLRVAA